MAGWLDRTRSYIQNGGNCRGGDRQRNWIALLGNLALAMRPAVVQGKPSVMLGRLSDCDSKMSATVFWQTCEFAFVMADRQNELA